MKKNTSLKNIFAWFMVPFFGLGLLFLYINTHIQRQLDQTEIKSSETLLHRAEETIKNVAKSSLNELRHDPVMKAAIDQKQFHGISSLFETKLNKYKLSEFFILNAKCKLIAFKSKARFNPAQAESYCSNSQLPKDQQIVRNAEGEYFYRIDVKDSQLNLYAMVAKADIQPFRDPQLVEFKNNFTPIYKKTINSLKSGVLVLFTFISLLVLSGRLMFLGLLNKGKEKEKELIATMKLILSGKSSRQLDQLLEHKNIDKQFHSKIKNLQNIYETQLKASLAMKSQIKKTTATSKQKEVRIEEMSLYIASLLEIEAQNRFAKDIVNRLFVDLKKVLSCLESQKSSGLDQIKVQSKNLTEVLGDWQEGVESRGARKYLRSLSETTLPGASMNQLSQNLLDIQKMSQSLAVAQSHVSDTQNSLNQNFTIFYQELVHWIGYSQKFEKATLNRKLLYLQASKRYSRFKFSNQHEDFSKVELPEILTKILPVISTDIFDAILDATQDLVTIHSAIRRKSGFIETVYSVGYDLSSDSCLHLRNRLNNVFSCVEGFKFFHSPHSFFPLIIRYSLPNDDKIISSEVDARPDSQHQPIKDTKGFDQSQHLS